MSWAGARPDRAAVYVDQSWFVLWPQATDTWARRNRPRRLPKAKSWGRKERPPATCLYASMDARTRQVEGEWHPTWNQTETWQHLKGLIRSAAARGIRFLIIVWDHAPWHTAGKVRQRVRRWNLWAKRHGRVRVLLVYLPRKAAWLMPLEGVFGQTKRAVGPRERETVEALHDAVDRRLERRNTWASEGRCSSHSSTQLLSA